MEHQRKLTKKIGIRHGQVFFLFVGFSLVFIFRSSITVGMVAMMDKDSKNPDVPILDWDLKQQSLILSSLYWGCVASHIPMGFLIQKVGGAHIALYCSMFVSSLMMLLTPILAHKLGWISILVSRIIMGIAQGAVMPCQKIQISKWVPPSERAQCGSLILNAAQLGIVCAMFFSGLLASTSFGWPSIFYTFGIIGMVWSVLYWLFSAESPADHKFISLAEKEFIEKSLGQASEEKNLPFPWKAVLTSVPVWSLIISGVCHTWCHSLIIMELPLFMKYILNFDLQQNGIFSALPYLAKWLLAFPIAWASGFALRKGFSVTVIRKTSNCIGMGGPALMLLILRLVDSSGNYLLINTLMILAVGLNAGISCGYEINEIDIAPNFVAMLSSLTVTMTNTSALIAPIVFGIIVTDPTNIDHWNTFFYALVAAYFLGNLVFLLFGKTEIQSWNGKMPPRTSRENINASKKSVV